MAFQTIYNPATKQTLSIDLGLPTAHQQIASYYQQGWTSPPAGTPIPQPVSVGSPALASTGGTVTLPGSYYPAGSQVSVKYLPGQVLPPGARIIIEPKTIQVQGASQPPNIEGVVPSITTPYQPSPSLPIAPTGAAPGGINWGTPSTFAEIVQSGGAGLSPEQLAYAQQMVNAGQGGGNLFGLPAGQTAPPPPEAFAVGGAYGPGGSNFSQITPEYRTQIITYWNKTGLYSQPITEQALGLTPALLQLSPYLTFSEGSISMTSAQMQQALDKLGESKFGAYAKDIGWDNSDKLVAFAVAQRELTKSGALTDDGLNTALAVKNLGKADALKYLEAMDIKDAKQQVDTIDKYKDYINKDGSLDIDKLINANITGVGFGIGIAGMTMLGGQMPTKRDPNAGKDALQQAAKDLEGVGYTGLSGAMGVVETERDKQITLKPYVTAGGSYNLTALTTELKKTGDPNKVLGKLEGWGFGKQDVSNAILAAELKAQGIEKVSEDVYAKLTPRVLTGVIGAGIPIEIPYEQYEGTAGGVKPGKGLTERGVVISAPVKSGWESPEQWSAAIGEGTQRITSGLESWYGKAPPGALGTVGKVFKYPVYASAEVLTLFGSGALSLAPIAGKGAQLLIQEAKEDKQPGTYTLPYAGATALGMGMFIKESVPKIRHIGSPTAVGEAATAILMVAAPIKGIAGKVKYAMDAQLARNVAHDLIGDSKLSKEIGDMNAVYAIKEINTMKADGATVAKIENVLSKKFKVSDTAAIMKEWNTWNEQYTIKDVKLTEFVGNLAGHIKGGAVVLESVYGKKGGSLIMNEFYKLDAAYAVKDIGAMKAVGSRLQAIGDAMKRQNIPGSDAIKTYGASIVKHAGNMANKMLDSRKLYESLGRTIDTGAIETTEKLTRLKGEGTVVDSIKAKIAELKKDRAKAAADRRKLKAQQAQQEMYGEKLRDWDYKVEEANSKYAEIKVQLQKLNEQLKEAQEAGKAEVPKGKQALTPEELEELWRTTEKRSFRYSVGEAEYIGDFEPSLHYKVFRVSPEVMERLSRGEDYAAVTGEFLLKPTAGAEPVLQRAIVTSSSIDEPLNLAHEMGHVVTDYKGRRLSRSFGNFIMEEVEAHYVGRRLLGEKFGFQDYAHMLDYAVSKRRGTVVSANQILDAIEGHVKRLGGEGLSPRDKGLLRDWIELQYPDIKGIQGEASATAPTSEWRKGQYRDIELQPVDVDALIAEHNRVTAGMVTEYKGLGGKASGALEEVAAKVTPGAEAQAKSDAVWAKIEEGLRTKVGYGEQPSGWQPERGIKLPEPEKPIMEIIKPTEVKSGEIKGARPESEFFRAASDVERMGQIHEQSFIDKVRNIAGRALTRQEVARLESVYRKASENWERIKQERTKGIEDEGVRREFERALEAEKTERLSDMLTDNPVMKRYLEETKRLAEAKKSAASQKEVDRLNKLMEEERIKVSSAEVAKPVIDGVNDAFDLLLRRAKQEHIQDLVREQRWRVGEAERQRLAEAEARVIAERAKALVEIKQLKKLASEKNLDAEYRELLDSLERERGREARYEEAPEEAILEKADRRPVDEEILEFRRKAGLSELEPDSPTARMIEALKAREKVKAQILEDARAEIEGLKEKGKAVKEAKVEEEFAKKRRDDPQYREYKQKAQEQKDAELDKFMKKVDKDFPGNVDEGLKTQPMKDVGAKRSTRVAVKEKVEELTPEEKQAIKEHVEQKLKEKAKQDAEKEADEAFAEEPTLEKAPKKKTAVEERAEAEKKYTEEVNWWTKKGASADSAKYYALIGLALQEALKPSLAIPAVMPKTITTPSIVAPAMMPKIGTIEGLQEQKIPFISPAPIYEEKGEEELQPSKFPWEQPYPYPQPQPAPEPQPIIYPQPIPTPEPEPAPQPQPAPEPYKPPPKEPTPTKITIIKPPKDRKEKEDKRQVAYGTWIWRHGAYWEVLEPPYDHVVHMKNPPDGAYLFATGKGSAKKTLQIIPKGARPPRGETRADVGWAEAVITVDSTQPGGGTVKFIGHSKGRPHKGQTKAERIARGEIVEEPKKRGRPKKEVEETVPLESISEFTADRVDRSQVTEGELVNVKPKRNPMSWEAMAENLPTRAGTPTMKEATLSDIEASIPAVRHFTPRARKKAYTREQEPYARYYLGRRLLEPDLSGALK